MTTPTVFVVDDEPAIRDALSLQITLKGLQVSVYSSADEFLAAYEPHMRGCLLTDLQMPGMGGLQLQETLRARGVILPVVVLTAHGDVLTTKTAMKNGAVDFLEKPAEDDTLIDVLRNAIRIDAERFEAESQRREVLERLERLSPRERDVLDLLAGGLQNREIAERLEISPRTVEVYKAKMMEKLRCRTLADVVRFGIDMRRDPLREGSSRPV
jgi:RNA polymerase sigma factor (sigma-70 family)